VVGVSGEGIHDLNVSTEFVFLAKNLHLVVLLPDSIAQSIFGTVSHEENGVARILDPIFQVVQNPACFAHPRSGNNNGLPIVGIEFL